MALFARSNHTREVELERRVSALQSALSQCKGVAQRWWSFRASFTIGVVVVALAIGFTLGVYRHTIGQAFLTTAVAVGVAGPRRGGGAGTDPPVPKGGYCQGPNTARPPPQG